MVHPAARPTYVTGHSPDLSVVRAIVAASAVPLMLMTAVALSSLFITEAPEPRRNQLAAFLPTPALDDPNSARVVHRAVHRFTGGLRGHWERNPLNIANQENYR